MAYSCLVRSLLNFGEVVSSPSDGSSAPADRRESTGKEWLLRSPPLCITFPATEGTADTSGSSDAVFVLKLVKLTLVRDRK